MTFLLVCITSRSLIRQQPYEGGFGHSDARKGFSVSFEWFLPHYHQNVSCFVCSNARFQLHGRGRVQVPAVVSVRTVPQHSGLLRVPLPAQLRACLRWNSLLWCVLHFTFQRQLEIPIRTPILFPTMKPRMPLGGLTTPSPEFAIRTYFSL